MLDIIGFLFFTNEKIYLTKNIIKAKCNKKLQCVKY